MTKLKTYCPSLSPCADVSAGSKNVHRYHELGLPPDWTAARIGSPGTWIGPDEYYWHPDEFFNVVSGMTPELLTEIRSVTGGAFHNLSLLEQCEVLGIPLDVKSPFEMYEEKNCLANNLGDGVEKFAFEYFSAQEWEGDWLEGSSFHFIMQMVAKRAMQKRVLYSGRWYSKFDADFDGICKKDTVESRDRQILWEIIDDINIDNLSGSYAVWKESVARKLPIYLIPRNLVDHFTVGDLISKWRALEKDKWVALFELDILGLYGFGWPDLTLHKNGRVIFIEVKQANDKFTIRQAYWWRNIGKPMGFDVRVLNVRPSIRGSVKRIRAASS